LMWRACHLNLGSIFSDSLPGGVQISLIVFKLVGVSSFLPFFPLSWRWSLYFIQNMVVWIVEFSSGGYKILPKNQHTQRKLILIIGVMGRCKKFT
jgi:hypothetical protein